MAHTGDRSAVVGEMLFVDDATVDMHGLPDHADTGALPDPSDIGGLPDAVDISGLPDEILIEIFSYLSLTDLAWSSHTCRRWHNVLKQKKSLWECKKCSTRGMGNIREVLAVAGALPQLKTLYLTYSREFRIDIAWPEATVYHHYGDAPLTWDPYFETFNTECLVLDHSMQKNVFFYLSWVDCRKLSRIVVLEHPHMSSRDIRPSALIGHVVGLPSCSRTSLDEPRMLGEKCSLTQLEGCGSATSSRRHDKCPKIVPQNGLPDVSSEEESRESRCQNSSDAPRVLGHKCSSSQSEGCVSATRPRQHDECVRTVTLDGLPEVSLEEETKVCPSLEEVNVFCKYIWDQHLENLCSLGPLRVLHIECQRLHSLTFVRCCWASLEVLIVTDCRCLLEDAYAELSVLRNVRILHLSNCRIEESTVRAYADSLPCLESFFLNGHKVH